MKNVDRAKAVHHLRRAECIYSSMRLLSDDLQEYAPVIPLLAVHGAVSLTDALLIQQIGKRSSDRDHRTVVKHLRSLCHSRNVPDDGIKRLDFLLAAKTDYAYGDRHLTLEEVKLAATAADRYQAWVYKTFPELGHEGDTAG